MSLLNLNIIEIKQLIFSELLLQNGQKIQISNEITRAQDYACT